MSFEWVVLDSRNFHALGWWLDSRNFHAIVFGRWLESHELWVGGVLE